MLLCQAKRQYLLTLQVSRYCLLALQCSIQISIYTAVTVYPVSASTVKQLRIKHDTFNRQIIQW